MAHRPTGSERRERLLERMHAVARSRHPSRSTEEAYRGWIVRYVRFHGVRHPTTLGADDVRAFLEWLATERTLAASTLKQAHALRASRLSRRLA